MLYCHGLPRHPSTSSDTATTATIPTTNTSWPNATTNTHTAI